MPEFEGDTQSVSRDPGTWVARWAWGRGRIHSAVVFAQIVTEGGVFLAAVPLAYVLHAGWPASMEPVQRVASNTIPLLLLVCRSPEFSACLPLLVFSPILHLLVFQWLGLYRDTPGNTQPFAATITIFKGVALGVALLAVMAMLYGATQDEQAIPYPALFFFFEATLTFFGVILIHSASLIGVLILLAFGIGRKRIAIIRGKESISALAEALSAPTTEYDLVGVIENEDAESPAGEDGTVSLGTLSNLRSAINTHNLSEVVLALDPGVLSAPRRLEVAQTCWRMGVELKMVTPFHPFFQTGSHAETVGNLSLLQIRNLGLYATVPQILKRVTDMVLAIIVSVIVSPIMVFAALLIKLDSKGPVFFVQERVGLNGRVFGMIKFRSMRVDADANADSHKEYLKRMIHGNSAGETDEAGKAVYKIVRDPRITRVGRLIRKMSIDELPQLLNVLRGEMSLVGPRPPVQYEVDEYQDWHVRRLHIRPGITGLWQVSGRSRLSFDQMVALDIDYIERWSLWLDLSILVRTIPAVFRTDQAF